MGFVCGRRKRSARSWRSCRIDAVVPQFQRCMSLRVFPISIGAPGGSLTPAVGVWAAARESAPTVGPGRVGNRFCEKPWNHPPRRGVLGCDGMLRRTDGRSEIHGWLGCDVISPPRSKCVHGRGPHLPSRLRHSRHLSPPRGCSGGSRARSHPASAKSPHLPRGGASIIFRGPGGTSRPGLLIRAP